MRDYLSLCLLNQILEDFGIAVGITRTGYDPFIFEDLGIDILARVSV